MRELGLLALYCALVVLASLWGGWLPSLVHLTHVRMQLMTSLVSGLMLGVALFHLLPHGVAELQQQQSAHPLDTAVLWVMVGLLLMFFLIRAFHFHQHEPPVIALEPLSGAGDPDPAPHRHEHHAAEHAHGHVHGHAHDHHGHGRMGGLSWAGVLLGLSLHSLIEGMALAASIQAESGNGAALSLLGLGTFLAILLHKPFDAVSITALMLAGGWPARWRNTVNAGFAAMVPIGAALLVAGTGRFSGSQHLIVGCALAFSAGTFLCISLGDLLPEIEFHSHDRVKLSAALLLGVAIAYAIGFFEPTHAHGVRP